MRNVLQKTKSGLAPFCPHKSPSFVTKKASIQLGKKTKNVRDSTK